MLYLFAQLPQLWIPSFVSASCTVVYSWPLWKNSPKRMFLSMGVLKTFLLAITWTYVTIWFPLAGKMLEWTPDFLLHLSFRFLFMLILCILFDKRDLEADQKRSYSSVATVFTDKQLKLLCNACFLLMLLVSLLSWKTNSSQTVLLSNLASVAAAYLLYRLSFKPRGYYFYYFLVDGLMLFSAMVTFIVHKLFFS
jgi:4-hydroxybenzoate polyprenyltransferase